jgi:hypothetical protein
MDNLPCEVIIYVLTAIDNISHALSGQSFDCFLQQSKIRIPCGIEYPSFNKFAFALFRMMSVLEHTPIHDFGRFILCQPTTRLWIIFLASILSMF